MSMNDLIEAVTKPERVHPIHGWISLIIEPEPDTLARVWVQRAEIRYIDPVAGIVWMMSLNYYTVTNIQDVMEQIGIDPVNV